MQAEHHHPCIPEKENVVAADQQRRGIKRSHVRRIVGPAQCGKRPKPRAEPCVQHVRILLQLPAAAFRAFFGRAGGHRASSNDGHSRISRRRDAAARAVPDRNAVSPPKLARDAPIANICQPVGENLALVVGRNLDQALLHRCQPSISQRPHLAKPLCRHARLDHGFASIAHPHRERMIVHFDEQSLRFQIGHHAAACVEPIQPRVRPRCGAHLPVLGHHVDLRKLMPAPHFEIVRIVRRSYFHRPGAEFAIHISVGDDGNFAVHQRQQNLLAHQMPVALVFRMHRDRRVP